VPIHNANFLGAALLCRLAKLTGDGRHVPAALAVARFSVGCQREDGSWPYGLGTTQQWVDNFHTGYNLCALKSLAADLATTEFDDALARGFAFYRAHFFTEESVARYYHDRTYPIDIHSVAQSLITLGAFREVDGATGLAQQVAAWAVDHMYDARGFFHYRKLQGTTIRACYMRWSQAWMMVGLIEAADQQQGVGC